MELIIKTVRFAVFSIFILLAGSCQKEISSEDNLINPPPPSAIALKKFVVIDPVLSSPDDTLGYIVYTYDNLNRCIQINSFDFPYEGTTEVHNYYIGNDTLIEKRKIIYDDPSQVTWEYFSYDANGQMLSDSVVDVPGSPYSVYDYQQSGNTVVSMIDFNSNYFLKGVHTITRDAIGNIISERDSAFQYNALTGYYFSDTSHVTVSYDNKHCPFYKLYPKRLIETDYESEVSEDVPLYWAILQQNNILSEVRTASQGGLTPFNHIYTYTYNANNYPTTVTFTDNVSGEILKGYYFY